jgi:hypothetical protein
MSKETPRDDPPQRTDQGSHRNCLQSLQSEYPGACQFTSYVQCMASATGKDDRCSENPRYEYARNRPAN